MAKARENIQEKNMDSPVGVYGMMKTAINEEAKKTTGDPIIKDIGQLAAVVASGMAGGISSALLGQRLLRKGIDAGEPLGRQGPRIIKELTKRHKLIEPALEIGGPYVELLGPHFRKIPKPTVAVTKNIGLPIFLHEMGHARQYSRPLGRLLLRAIQPAAALGSIGGMASIFADKEQWAPYLYGAGALPLLGAEAGASLFSLRELARRGGWRQALRGVGPLAKGFGTYALMAGGPVLGSALVAKYLAGKGTPANEEPSDNTKTAIPILSRIRQAIAKRPRATGILPRLKQLATFERSSKLQDVARIYADHLESLGAAKAIKRLITGNTFSVPAQEAAAILLEERVKEIAKGIGAIGALSATAALPFYGAHKAIEGLVER